MVTFIDSIGLLPQQVRSESPERGLDSLLAVGIRRDTPSCVRCTASKTYSSHNGQYTLIVANSSQ